MDPLHTTPIEKDKLEIVVQKEIEKQEKLVGRIKPQRGHTLFEVNLKEKTIEKVLFEVQDIHFDKAKNGITTAHKKVIRKPNCIYISALNRKNVIKKLVKRGIVKLKKK